MNGRLWASLYDQPPEKMDSCMVENLIRASEKPQNVRAELVCRAADGDENAKGAFLESLMPVMLSRMKKYADMIGYPTVVMKAAAGSVEEYLDFVKWDSDENIEHNLIRQIQYATTRECRGYRMIHAKELLSHKLDARSEAEYRTIRDKLKISDEERFADAWLDMSDRDRRIICMRFGVEGGKSKTLEEVASAFHMSRERVSQIEKKFIRRLSGGCVFSKKMPVDME